MAYLSNAVFHAKILFLECFPYVCIKVDRSIFRDIRSFGQNFLFYRQIKRLILTRILLCLFRFKKFNLFLFFLKLYNIWDCKIYKETKETTVLINFSNFTFDVWDGRGNHWCLRRLYFQIVTSSKSLPFIPSNHQNLKGSTTPARPCLTYMIRNNSWNILIRDLFFFKISNCYHLDNFCYILLWNNKESVFIFKNTPFTKSI